MFSIAAINESDTGGQWEPLAPTKEAQESALSHKYHEGLLKLQEKDYSKARELLEDVLKDPLISKIQADNIGSDQHLLQLRFLTLKNLASIFLRQGSEFNEKALHCYLQAVELDSNDSVVWNHLGTLSCSMGLLSLSRWAFEQGLVCSPNNWNCMEKLLEVLIAIGDEVACLSVANLLIRGWPSHHRALHVQTTIEDAEPLPFAPRGIDLLKPEHHRLSFSTKRKSADDEICQEPRTKKSKHESALHISEPKWTALLDGILSFLTGKHTKADEDHGTNTETAYSGTGGRVKGVGDSMMNVVISMDTSKTMESASGNGNDFYDDGESLPSHDCKATVKEKDANSDREHAHERRSRRLERLRSRKSGKDENESNGKDISNAITQFLDSFILKGPNTTESTDCSGNFASSLEPVIYTSDREADDVKEFLCKISKNHGPRHIGYMLLEEIAHLNIPFQDYFVNFIELDKLTRGWAQERSAPCSLFLAELYYDQAMCSGSPSLSSELSDSSYHLCKVIESVALESPFGTFVDKVDSTSIDFDKDNRKTGVFSSDKTGRHASDISKSFVNSDISVSSNMICDEKSGYDSSFNTDCVFWIRFFWLSGCLSLSEDRKERAYKEFHIALSLLRSSTDAKGSSRESIPVPHSKLVKFLTADRILREINLIKLYSLLWKNDENIKNITHTEFKELLPPLLLSTKDVYVGNVYGPPNESEDVISLELSALDVLISACEKSKPMNIHIYLDSHRRKLQVLTVTAGMVGSLNPHKGKSTSDDFLEAMNRNRLESVVEAVKDISRNASEAKGFIDQSDTSVTNEQDGLSSLVYIIGGIQSLLLSIMCAAVKMILSRKVSCSGTSSQADQLESSCLVDAAIAFCKLQHLDPTVSVKTQVDLIVAVHDLLSEYGLCCAGRDGEGAEGTFLKFAIKHLMALDVKLKSQLNPNGMEEDALPETDRAEDSITDEPSICDDEHNSEDDKESELEEIQSSIDSALDQAFFCLYGLKINPDSSSEDELAVHKNTSRGDYQTKEQCADVFQYVLPYARALSKTGLVKLRRVLRAIRKHFPQPPYDLLVNNPLDNFLDGPDSCEKTLCEIYETHGSTESILNVLFPGERGYEVFKKLSTDSSEPYVDVYGNLYYYIAQAEDISATDKYTGFVLKKEGGEFVEQGANLFKYDLLYNPSRFESWKKLANLYDEEVDLLLNDGSKHISILDWRTNTTLTQRVEIGRRHSRRCLLMSLALAKTTSEQIEMHEMLALVYYDSLQNVVPFYDQRATLPVKDSTWETFCRNSMKHFEKAFELKEQWLYAFYLGKLCEKLGHSPAKAFSYYDKAVVLNPTAVDPVYRMHASRMKLLYTGGKQNLDAIQVVADYTYNQLTKENVLSMLRSITNVQHPSSDQNDKVTKKNEFVEPDLLDKVWHILYDDCLYALGTCVEGELKHFHKARYKLAQGLYRRAEEGDLERAKEELSFCFKSTRSPFTVNMWEIDGHVRKGRRKNPNIGGSRKNLEVSLSESSRKFITCIRKYMLFYLNLLEKNRDLWTLERAYTYLRTDKRFALCLGDIVPLGLGKYLQVLTAAIRDHEIRRVSGDAPVEQLLEKMFGVFMDHANLWADISTIPEVNCPELSESNLYSYIHQYIHLLESDVRLDVLEALNEKIRKRFKTPKLSNSNFAKICKHASLSWCRCILIKLASITPLPESMDTDNQLAPLSSGLLLYVDLQPDELLISSPDGSTQFKGLDMNWFETLNRIKNIPIRQTSEDNMETAVTVMKSTYNFYRDSSCGTFPSGINLYTVTPSQSPVGGLQQAPDVVDTLDLSIPRKLLLWVYTLVHGRYSNISAVVKYCDEMKARNKRGTSTSTASPQATQPTPHGSVSSQVNSKEKSTHIESSEAPEANPSAPAVVSIPPHHGAGDTSNLVIAIEAQKLTATVASELTRSSSSRGIGNAHDSVRVTDGTS